MNLKTYILNILVAIDQLINAIFKGDPDETISSRAAKSAIEGRAWGCYLCKFLNYLEENHCEKQIEYDRGAIISRINK